jgi:hypothetical protein
MQTEVTVSINGAEPVPAMFSMDTAVIDVSGLTASKPDMSWEFIDAAGHFHAYDHEGNLPTIVHREERIEVERGPEPDLTQQLWDEDADDFWTDDDDERDGYSITHIECGICGEAVTPQRITSDPRRMIPGRTDYRLTLHSPIPEGRFSVLVTIHDKAWFGFAEGRRVGAVHHAFGKPVERYEAWCGPMSWRKRNVVPQV